MCACVLLNPARGFSVVQVAKLPQVVQQQTPVAGLPQVAAASQQVGVERAPIGGPMGFSAISLRVLGFPPEKVEF